MSQAVRYDTKLNKRSNNSEMAQDLSHEKIIITASQMWLLPIDSKDRD